MFHIIPRYSINLSSTEIKFIVKLFNKKIDISKDEVLQFENEFANYIGTKYSFSTLSATTALFIILRYGLKFF